MRFVVQYKDGHINIPADRMEKQGDMLYVYRGNELVATVFVNFVNMAYLTESSK